MKTITISTILCFFSYFINAQEHTRIDKGIEITRGNSIYAKNGKYQLSLQNDGNLVLYRIYSNSLKPLWSTESDSWDIEKCVFQTDGNLVLYRANGNAHWASSTDNIGHYLLLQNDGNLVIYNSNDKPVWSSNTYEKN